MGLKRYKLGDLIEVTRGQSLAGEFYAEEGKYIRLTLGNFDYANGGFKPNTSKTNLYYTGPIKEQFILEEGDIITPLTEQTPGLLGSTARIPISGTYIQSQDVALVRCKDGMIDPAFCYYLLPSSSVKKQLAAGAQQTKIRHTSPDKIKDVVVDIPDISEQRQIGQLLDAITHKIELNRSINQNLEALAKQLYDYWFVQFDFPDENGRPYKSSGGAMVWNDGLNKYIPNYWNVLKLSDLLREDRVKQINPQDNPNKVFRHLSFPSLDACGSFYEEKGENIKSNKIVVKDEYVLAAKLNPWIKRIAWGTTDEDLICSTEFVVLNPYDKNLKAFLFLLVNQKPFIDYCTSSSTGTSHSQRRVKPDIMKLYKFPYNEKVAQEFSKQVLPIIEITKKNNEQNRELAMQRDKLLPLLMNGQVSLNSDLAHD